MMASPQIELDRIYEELRACGVPVPNKAEVMLWYDVPYSTSSINNSTHNNRFVVLKFSSSLTPLSTPNYYLSFLMHYGLLNDWLTVIVQRV